MCAINGITNTDEQLVAAMNAATSYRGPEGSSVSVVGTVTLGHNRLAIIDLSPGGAQPMEGAGGRYTVVYNGELYNYKELKAELHDYPFRSDSDTEVVLAAWSVWGEAALSRMNGIFAFALFDAEDGTLYLARDRSGIKPLYVYQDKKGLRFSSEIAGLLADPSIPRTLSKPAFASYVRFLYTPAPDTLFSGITTFPPGHVGRFTDGTFESHAFGTPEKKTLPTSREERMVALRDTLASAVTRQLVSDRPVGILLSGGLDSSILLAEATKTHPAIHTFSASFALGPGEEEAKFNADAVLARESAKYFGATHHELVIEERDLPKLLLDAAAHLGEPIANPTVAAQLALARFAKKDATVVLTGDGGDELFGGYPRYRLSRLMDSYQGALPSLVRRTLSGIGPFGKLNTSPGYERVARFLMLKDEELARVLRETSAPPQSAIQEILKGLVTENPTEQLMEFDRHTWLVDEALLRTDRLSMAAAVEARTPFLDDEVVAFARALPMDEKVNEFTTKIVLRDAYRSLLPQSVIAAPKRGWFSPGAKWLRRPDFLSFAREVLSVSYHEPTSRLFDWKKVEDTLERHERGEYHLHPLWMALSFQLWAKAHNVNL